MVKVERRRGRRHEQGQRTKFSPKPLTRRQQRLVHVNHGRHCNSMLYKRYTLFPCVRSMLYAIHSPGPSGQTQQPNSLAKTTHLGLPVLISAGPNCYTKTWIFGVSFPRRDTKSASNSGPADVAFRVRQLLDVQDGATNVIDVVRCALVVVDKTL